jgi:2-keto-4-pentenoate hydratase
MCEMNPRVLAAQRAQLLARAVALDSGATHVGWKAALGIPGADQLIGQRPVLGYLTSATRFESGSVFEAEGIRKLQVDCELAVELGDDLAGDADIDTVASTIVGFATALELCDVGRPPADFDSIVAANVFHRAYALGPSQSSPATAPTARVHVNGELRHEAMANIDHVGRILAVAQLLEAVGERLRRGDRIICGAICGGLLDRGDEVAVAVGQLGTVRVTVAP